VDIHCENRRTFCFYVLEIFSLNFNFNCAPGNPVYLLHSWPQSRLPVAELTCKSKTTSGNAIIKQTEYFSDNYMACLC
jgi:hypothetical protein